MTRIFYVVRLGPSWIGHAMSDWHGDYLRIHGDPLLARRFATEAEAAEKFPGLEVYRIEATSEPVKQ